MILEKNQGIAQHSWNIRLTLLVIANSCASKFLEFVKYKRSFETRTKSSM
jgi:hypothetical protein